MEIFKLFFLNILIFICFLLTASPAIATRSCSTAGDCRTGEICSEIRVGGDQCVNSSTDAIYYITGRCSGVGAVACPTGFSCESISPGKYCTTNETGMATTMCSGEGELFIDGRCQVPPAESVEWTSPISGTSPSKIIGRIIKTVLGVIGAIALLIFVYGGLMWMTAAGSPEKIKKAQTTLVWAVLGLVVIFASYTLVDFIIERLT